MTAPCPTVVEVQVLAGPRGPPGPPGQGGDAFPDAVGDGVTDDSEAIQLALDGAAEAGGGRVMLEGKAYALATGLDIPSGVSLMGVGAGQYPLSAFIDGPNFKAQPKTRLVALAGFPANMAVVRVAATSADTYARQAVTLSGLFIDAANIAERGLDVISAKNCFFNDLTIFRPTSIGILEDCLPQANSGTALAGTGTTITLAAESSSRDDAYNGQTITLTGGTGNGQTRTISDYVGATGVATVSSSWSPVPDATSIYSIPHASVTEGNGAVQFCEWTGITVHVGNTGSVRGWVLDGNTINNVNQNRRFGIKVVHADGDGIDIRNSDSDVWVNVSTFCFGTSPPTYGMRLRGNDKNHMEFARNLQFFGTLMDGGMIVHGGAAQPSNFNVVYDYSGDTVGIPDPVLEERAGLTWHGASGRLMLSQQSEGHLYTERTGAWGIGAAGSWRHKARLGTGSMAEFGRIVARHAGLAGAEQQIWDIWSYIGGVPVWQMSIGDGVSIFNGVRVNGGIFATEAASDARIYTDYLGDFAVGGTGSWRHRNKLGNGVLTELGRIQARMAGASGTEQQLWDFYSYLNGAAAMQLTIGDGISVGGGTSIRKILQAAPSFDFPSVAAGGTQSLTVTVTGAGLSDGVFLGLPSNGYAAGLMFKGYVSAADTVTVQAINATAAPIDPAPASMRVIVFKYSA